MQYLEIILKKSDHLDQMSQPKVRYHSLSVPSSIVLVNVSNPSQAEGMA